jgi:hypothetical protein
MGFVKRGWLIARIKQNFSVTSGILGSLKNSHTLKIVAVSG